MSDLNQSTGNLGESQKSKSSSLSRQGSHHHQTHHQQHEHGDERKDPVSPLFPITGHLHHYDDENKIVIDATDLPDEREPLAASSTKGGHTMERKPSASASSGRANSSTHFELQQDASAISPSTQLPPPLPPQNGEKYQESSLPPSPSHAAQQEEERPEGCFNIAMYYLKKEHWTDGTWRSLIDDILAGITLTMTQVPSVVAFSLLAHMNPVSGLYTAFWIGLFMAIFGGRPGTISANAGALAVTYPTIVDNYGPDALIMASILAAILHMLPGIFQVSKFVRLLPASVMIGFVDGLGFTLARGQISAFQDVNGEYVTGAKAGYTAMLTIICFLIMFIMPYFTKIVPSTFVALVVGTVIEHAFQLGTVTVGDLYNVKGSFPVPQVPNVDWSNSGVVGAIISMAFVIFVIGSVESLLTCHILNVFTEHKASFERESITLGLSNILASLWGGYGGCAVIGASILNFHSGGGYRRVSGFITGVLMIVTVLGLYKVVNWFPMGALSAVVFGIAVKTFDFRTFDMIFNMKIPATDSFIIIVVTVVTVFTDLAVGVGVGVGVAMILFAWDMFTSDGFKVTDIEIEEYEGDDERIGHDNKRRVKACVFKLKGTLFFFSASEALGVVEALHLAGKDRGCSDIVFDFGNGDCTVRDFSVVDAMNEIATMFTRHGKRFHMRNMDMASRMIAERAIEFAAAIYNDKKGAFDDKCVVFLPSLVNDDITSSEDEELKDVVVSKNNDDTADEKEKKQKEGDDENASDREDNKKNKKKKNEKERTTPISEKSEEELLNTLLQELQIIVFVYCSEIEINLPLHPFSFEEFKSVDNKTLPCLLNTSKEAKLARFSNVTFKYEDEDLKKQIPDVEKKILEKMRKEF